MIEELKQLTQNSKLKVGINIMLRIPHICELKCIKLVFSGQPKTEEKYECVCHKGTFEKKVKPSTDTHVY